VGIRAIPGPFGVFLCGCGMKNLEKQGALRQKLALFLRLYENDTKAKSSFLYHLSGARFRVSDCPNSDLCDWPSRAGGAQPTTNQALHARERILEWKLHVP
jgi:hypothetical protein